MFGLFKKKEVPLRGLLEGFYDVHSHLLWGVDDGCPTAEKTVAVAEALGRLGVKGAYLTPHIIYGVHGNRSEGDMRARMEEMPNLGEFQVRLAAEYFLDENFMSHVEGPEPLLTLADGWMLVEYGMASLRTTHHEELFEVAIGGTNIIVAHPERYAFLCDHHNLHELSRLTDKNYALQLNLLSLTGYYGERVRRTAEELLLGGHYLFVGSDTHNLRYVAALEEGQISPKCVEPLRQLMENNKKILWK